MLEAIGREQEIIMTAYKGGGGGGWGRGSGVRISTCGHHMSDIKSPE